MDLILEDIGKIPQYKNAIRNAIKITNHVYNHATLHSKWLETTKGKELVRPGVTRFATAYLTLKSLHEQSDVLRKFDWRPWARKGDGLTVADLVVNTRFWMTVEDCLKASEPILVVLRLVDNDSKPNLSSLAAAFLKAKDAIMRNFENIERDYMPILKILESRWSKHFQSPLFKAAAFLNPGVYYKIKRYLIHFG